MEVKRRGCLTASVCRAVAAGMSLAAWTADAAVGGGAEVPESVTAAYGPNGNRADLMRQFGGVGRLDLGFGVHERLLDMGFNTYSYHVPSGFWNYRKNEPGPEHDKFLAVRKAFFDRLQRDGVSVIDSLPGVSSKAFVAEYPRLYADGTKNLKALDASRPEVVKIAKAVAESLATNGRHPAVIGFEAANEVRFRSHFSFTPQALAAYRAHAGCDVPAEVRASKGDDVRFAPHWSKIAGFPSDRIVPDDYPLLDFYRWAWRTGDGWNGFCTDVTAAYRRALGRDVFGMYSPALRTPAMWGTLGEVNLLRNWEYPYPEPYRVAYTAAGLQAMAREKDQLVLVSVQAIAYRSRLAPIGEHPKDEPAWTRRFPNCWYPTAPADLVREGMWAVLARRIDGICTHGFDALMDVSKVQPVEKDYDLGEKVYRCADPQAAEAVKDVFHRAAMPLGPLLRAVPERAPQVAVLASSASQILGSRVTWSCQGRFFDAGVLAIAANLCPYAVNEDELATRGLPPSVRLLVMTDCDVLSRSAYERIAAFVKRGGRIVASEELVPALKADAELPSVRQAFAAKKSDHDDGKASKAVDAEAHDRALKRAAAELRAIARRWFEPYVATDQTDLFAHVRSWGRADYVFPLNDRRTFGDYVGPWRRVMEKGLPNEGTVVVRRPAGAVYDLVKHEAVPFESRDGVTRIPVSFATSEGTVLMVVDRPLGALAVSVAGTKVTVRSPDREVMLPICVEGFGRPFYGVLKDGAWAHDFGTTPTDAVCVVNLATGKSFPVEAR